MICTSVKVAPQVAMCDVIPQVCDHEPGARHLWPGHGRLHRQDRLPRGSGVHGLLLLLLGSCCGCGLMLLGGCCAAVFSWWLVA